MKKIVLIGLFVSLFAGTSLWSRLYIEEDSFVLGTSQWMEELAEADNDLDNLEEAFEQAAGTNRFEEARYAYGYALNQYFNDLVQDVSVVDAFFTFAPRLDEGEREDFARRLLNVIWEHQQFLRSDPHTGNLAAVLGYTREAIGGVIDHVQNLSIELDGLVPHEADEMSDIEDMDDEASE